MNVGGFPSHGVQKPEFGVGGAQRSQFDAGTMRAEAAHDPTPAQLDEGIGTAHSTIEDGLVENVGGTVAVLSPESRRWHQRFGFTRDTSTAPISDSNITGVAQAAESGNTMSDAKLNIMRGHEVLQSIDGADGNFSFQRGKRVHFLPEMDRVAQFTFSDQAKPLMIFAKYESAAFFTHTLAVAFEQGIADVFAFEGKTSGLGCEMGANSQTHQIDGIGHGPGFIEIIDSPDEAAFNVAPGAEILHVEIANG